MDDVLSRLRSALAGRYTLERELGRGGMATVWLARDLKHDRPVALKVLRPELAQALGPERFLREIQIAARLTHPHIVPLHDSGDAGGFLFYVMPYVEGESLRDRLFREKQLPVDDALQISREVADALSYAHGHDVVHRDIKPENILLEAGHAVVADFGIARAITAAGGERLTETGVAVGTPPYMSPEQAAGSRDLDGRSDLYSLGCVLYEMLAGRPPFVGPTAESVAHQHLTADPPVITAIRPAVPAAVAAALSRALAKTPADRFHPVALFEQALREASTAVDVESTAHRPPSIRRVVAAAGAVGLALGVTALAVLLLRPKTGTRLDPNLLAVAPFDVVTTAVEEYREGLMTILSRTLDGAGPIRTISPTVVVRRWSGRSDPTSARAFGRATGAGLVVFGQAVPAGADSVVLTATVYDVDRAHAVGEVEVRDERARIDRVADSLAVRVLRQLGRTRPVGAVRFAALGSTSLPAIKLFLRAEQFYRQGQWDSTLAYAQQAVAVDSTFTLALRRIPNALWWDDASNATPMLLRAGATNHGLAPRESLLVTLDSLWGALGGGTSAWWPLLRRLASTVEEAVTRYPEDPETWYMKGEVATHYGPMVAPRLGTRVAFDAFARAVTLDSAFAPAFEHLVRLALLLEEPARSRQYADAFLHLHPQEAPWLRASLDLLSSPSHPSAATVALLDTTAASQLRLVINYLGSTDSGEAGVIVARAQVKARGDEAFRWWAPLTLAERGHVREAAEVLWAYGAQRNNGAKFTALQLLLVGALPPDSVARWLDALLRDGVGWAGVGLAWWAARGDTASILRLARHAESKHGSAAPGSREAEYWTYCRAAVHPYLALAHHDTTRALDLFANLPDSLCRDCFRDRLARIRLLSTQRQDREAAALLDEPLYSPYIRSTGGVLWSLERGRVNERLGNRDKAVESYAYVAAVWRHADAELQPYVEEARAGLARLTGERQP